MIEVTGKCSFFGGPGDSGVAPTEGLALMYAKDLQDPKFRDLFELEQPVGTTGLARRLDPKAFYLAMRWDYDVTSVEWLRENASKFTVAFGETRVTGVQPVDWGPNENTRRVVDCSLGLLRRLGAKTDDVLTVTIDV